MKERISYAKRIWTQENQDLGTRARIWGIICVLFGKYEDGLGYNADTELLYFDTRTHYGEYGEYAGWTVLAHTGFRWTLYDDSSM